MTAVLNVTLLALAGLSILGAFYYAVRGIGSKSDAQRQAYNVGQVEAKRVGRMNLVRAAFLFVLGLLILGAFAARPYIARVVTIARPTPVVPTVDAAATQEAATRAAPTVEPTVEASPTSPPASPSPEATIAPTDTPTPATAVVSSGVGVWLRGAPSTTGEQLKWLLDGTEVTLLAGQETADEFLWQQVRTENGVEGWVAGNYLAPNEPEP